MAALAAALARAPAPAADAPAPGAGAPSAAVFVEPIGLGPSGVDRVRVVARGAPREDVLAALAQAAGFAVAEGLGRPAPRRLALELPEATLEDALAGVLEGVPYHLHYEPGPDGVSLRRVTVGLLPPPRAARRAPSGTGLPPPARGTDFGARAGAVRSEEERRERLDALRGARSDADRAEAASLMRPDDDLPGLLAFLRDRNPEVRARAAASLGEVDLDESAFRATEALLEALRDPDPGVVAAVVHALGSLHDVLPHPRIRAAVAALEGHRDPAVRDAVASFRAWAEDEAP